MVSKRKIREAQEYYENMPPLQAPIPGVQLAQDLSPQNVDIAPQRQLTLKDKITDALLGQRAPMTDNITLGEDTMNATVSQNPRVGGLLNDIAGGFRENYANGFNVNNLGNNLIDENRPKGFGYRLGEGLGTLGRFIDSPLGRGVLAAGLNSALGYNNSLQEGLTAGVGRQRNQTMDRLYRDQLKRDYGYSDEDLADIRGNIDTNTFNSLTKSQNSAQSLAIRKQTAESMNNLRALQAKRLEIINSNLPEQEKAKTLKMITDAEYAEQMNLARINFYNNSAALGWANYGLKADEAQRKAELDELKAEIIKSLKEENSNTPSSKKEGGVSTPKTGKKLGTVKIKAPNGDIREVPASQKDYYIKKGGVVI